MKEKVGILSLGCPRNLVDAENIAGRLDGKGYRIVEDMAQADIALVNTCAFIEEAKKESIDAILELVKLKRQGRLKKIIVCGCLAQRYGAKLTKELPEVDAFAGALALNHQARVFRLTPGHYGYLKICEGCINKCSYCVIPGIKGKFVSLDEESLLKRVAFFESQGISELNIIGQDISAYGMDSSSQPALARIVRKICASCSHIKWIRLLYLHPRRINRELFELIRDEKRICKYIDLPLQHINNRILKLMRRQSSKEEIMRLIARIRKTVPGAALRTSFIVGFPSETEAEFGELLSFIKETKFERLGAFMYSREEGTAAYSFKGQLPESVKRERWKRLMSVQQDVSRELNAKLLGRVMKVLIEEKSEGGLYLGRSQFDAPEVDGLVYVKSPRPLKNGGFVNVRINDTMEYDLAGEALR